MGRLPDHLRPGLRVVFVGINPGLASAETGHHYAGRGNRFWPALFASGLVDRPLAATDDATLPALGYGLTNLVDRESPGVGDLTPAELAAGWPALQAKLVAVDPEWVVFVGLTVFRAAFGVRGPLACGPRPERVGRSRCWVLPNPSGRNAHFTMAGCVDAFGALALELARPRFVVLAHHTTPFHHDLLLEKGDVCWTWRLPAWPEAEGAERIADHRPYYLTYEGAVSGDRGHVERVDRGTYRVLTRRGERLYVALDGLDGERRLALQRR